MRVHLTESDIDHILHRDFVSWAMGSISYPDTLYHLSSISLFGMVGGWLVVGLGFSEFFDELFYSPPHADFSLGEPA